jgi:hypothetical protein
MTLAAIGIGLAVVLYIIPAPISAIIDVVVEEIADLCELFWGD